MESRCITCSLRHNLERHWWKYIFQNILWWCTWSPTWCTKEQDKGLNIFGIKKHSIKNYKILKGGMPVSENGARVSLNYKLWWPAGHCSCFTYRDQQAWRRVIVGGVVSLKTGGNKCCCYMMKGRKVYANTQVTCFGFSWYSLTWSWW